MAVQRTLIAWSPPIIAGKYCPRCQSRTDRVHSPPWLRPLKWLAFGHLSYRHCRDCDWQGIGVHERP